jgi:hypothetical protein
MTAELVPDLATRRRKWIATAILVVAAALRLGQLDAQSLSMDEIKDLAMARGGVVALQDTSDRFPPLYHVLLGQWLKVVPWDETGRGFSALCGMLTVVAAGGLARVIGGERARLAATALMAVAPFAVWYSVEARAYSLYLLLGAVALWQFAAAMATNRWPHWLCFAAASIAGAYTHYYFGLLIAVTGLTFLAFAPGRATIIRGLTTFSLIAAATTPSLWLLKQDLDHPWGYARTSSFTLPALGYTYFSYLSGYTLGPSLRDLHTLPSREAVVQAAPWVAPLGVATGALCLQALRQVPAGRRFGAALAFAAFCLAPAAICGFASQVASFGYNARHALWACVPLMAALGVGLARGRPRWLTAAATGMLLIAFAAAHVNRLAASAHTNEDGRGVAEYIAARPQRALFVMSGYMQPPISAYLPDRWPTFPLSDAEADEGDVAEAVASVRRHAAPNAAFWLAYTREFHGDPQGKVLAELQEAFPLELEAEFAGIRLYRGATR